MEIFVHWIFNWIRGTLFDENSNIMKYGIEKVIFVKIKITGKTGGVLKLV